MAYAAVQTVGYGFAQPNQSGADVGELDRLAPLLGFVGDHLTEVLRRAAQDQHAHFVEPLLNLGIGEAAVDLGIELVDDLGRRAARCANAPP